MRNEKRYFMRFSLYSRCYARHFQGTISFNSRESPRYAILRIQEPMLEKRSDPTRLAEPQRDRAGIAPWTPRRRIMPGIAALGPAFPPHPLFHGRAPVPRPAHISYPIPC